ncbi:hypothetical protein HY285_04545 [Candidatus Peregrinibacteria bacterium]|nr:hypothetical protein [Candidatus Peregrinibacteria bacterium]MBI3816782.1 hypothetical protein [Candidatus Peregrinibacteria bacterium]
MAKKRPPTGFSFLADAWEFSRKQPALSAVVLWFFILPWTAMDLLSRLTSDNDLFDGTALHAFLAKNDPHNIVVTILTLGLIVLTVWGTASILFVARRMIGNRAGRSRTSFLAVQKQSRALVWPLILTSLLRTCITIEWGLLFLIPALFVLLQKSGSALIRNVGALLSDGDATSLIAHTKEVAVATPLLFMLFPLLIPAILYRIRTSFFAVALIAEDLRLRAALRQSARVVKGKFWYAVRCLLIMAVVWILPAKILSMILQSLIERHAPSLILISDILGNTFDGASTLLFLLSLTALYGALREPRVETVAPPKSD